MLSDFVTCPYKFENLNFTKIIRSNCGQYIKYAENDILVYCHLCHINEYKNYFSKNKNLFISGGDVSLFDEGKYIGIRGNGETHNHAEIDKKYFVFKKMYGHNIDISPREMNVENIPIGILDKNLELFKSLFHTHTQDEKIYINFQIPACGSQRYREIRKQVYEIYQDNQNFVINQKFKGSLIDSHANYFNECSKHKYMLCPEGNGIDTYRIWEAIYFGNIPIIQKCNWSQSFIDYPIIQVGNILDINYNFIVSESERIKNLDFNLNKLTNKYWETQLNG